MTTEERNAYIVDLLLHNGGCSLPWFWGFTPGETSWEEADRVLDRIGDEVEGAYDPGIVQVVYMCEVKPILYKGN